MKCKKTTVIVDNVGRQTIGDINNYIVELEQQCKKQKEVIDKAIEYITSAIENDDIEELKSARHLMLWNEDLDKLLEILKGSGKE